MSQPILFLPHGGGPLPLLGDPSHASLVTHLSQLGQNNKGVTAAIVVSAHWEASEFTILNKPDFDLLYDYAGFPAESYQVQYPAHGDAALADSVVSALKQQGINTGIEAQRGLDHGVFVPLKILYPSADVPIVQVSLKRDLNAEQHIALGRALAPLITDGVQLIGSGFSFHNLAEFFRPRPEHTEKSKVFNDWLVATIQQTASAAERLAAWTEAPYARFAHPREEHLLPLHVCVGAAAALNLKPEVFFNETMMGMWTAGFTWS